MGVVFDTPAIDGLTSVGELFSNKAEFEAEGMAALFKMIMGATEYEELANSVVDIFSMAGINDSIADFLDNAYDEIGQVIFEDTLLPLFGCWPSVWTMIPDEYIDDVTDNIFSNYFSDESYAALKTRIESYNKNIRLNKYQTLLDFDSVGRVAVISRYGYSAVPVSGEWELLSDAVIETKNSSLGATTVKVGEHFSDEYLDGKEMKYISPDKTIDASTCLFPEKTWFIKNAVHTEVSAVAMPYYKQLLFSQQEATCDNSELSRFVIYDAENKQLTADESVPVKAENQTMLERIFNFVKALINKLFDLFRK
jgi:hypothetical protein